MKGKIKEITRSNINTGAYKTSFLVMDKIKEVEKYILSKKYGEIVTHLALSTMLGYDIEDEKQKGKYKRTMAKIKDKLIEEKYILRSGGKEGYYILRPNEVANHCYRTYVKRTMDLLYKSDRLLVNTDKEKLYGNEKTEYDEMFELNNQLNDKIWENISQSRYYKRMEHAEKIMEGKK